MYGPTASAMAQAQRTARAGPSKVARNPSPSDFTSLPRERASSRRCLAARKSDDRPVTRRRWDVDCGSIEDNVLSEKIQHRFLVARDHEGASTKTGAWEI